MKGLRTRGDRPFPWLQVILSLLYVAFLAGGIYFGYLFYATVKEVVTQTQPAPPPNPPAVSEETEGREEVVVPPKWEKQERMNILFLGLDQREGEYGPWRTDTMIVVTIDPETKTAGMLSIPRDLWVLIPGYGENRINTAHFFGDRDEYPGGGPALAKETVQYNFGVPIHRYVRVNFRGFKRMIDAIGGITIDVEEPIRDNRYPDENYGYKTIFIPAGLQHMDGETALQYARTRYGGSDFARIRRQQKVLLAIRDKVLSLRILSTLSPNKLIGLMSAARDTVQTDLQPSEILTLAQIAAQIDQEDIKGRVIDETMTTPVIVANGADVLFPNREKIKEVVDELFPPAPQPDEEQLGRIKGLAEEAARIVVQNGTTKGKLAEETAAFLQGQGYQVVGYGDADRFDYPKTIIIDYSGKSYTVGLLARLFQVEAENVRRSPNSESRVDIRIIIGEDFDLPAR